MAHSLRTVDLSNLHEKSARNTTTNSLQVKQLLKIKQCMRCNLNNANLSSSNLIGADLSYADLSNANMSHTNLFGANLNNANMSNAKLGGARTPNRIIQK